MFDHDIDPRLPLIQDADLRERGVEALRTHPEMEPLDGMLRGLVAGFLLGRQENE